MFSFQIKTKQAIEERRREIAVKMRAAGVFLVAILFAWGAWVRAAASIHITYSVVAFCIIFFGAIWVETLYRRLLRYPTNHNKFVGWFFAACVTAWWLGVEISRYVVAMRSGVVSFAFIDYTSWVTYVSLFLILAIGYAALTMVRKNQPLSERREYEVLVGVFVLLVVLGALSSLIIER